MKCPELHRTLLTLALARSITAKALLSSNSNIAMITTISSPQPTSTIIPGHVDVSHANDDGDDLVLALGTTVSGVEVLHTTLTAIIQGDATAPWHIEKRAKRTGKHHSTTTHKSKHASKHRHRHRTTSKSHHFTISPASTRPLTRHGLFGQDQIATLSPDASSSSDSNSDSTITLDDGREMVCDSNKHCAWQDSDGFLFPIRNGDLPDCDEDNGDDADGPGYCLSGKVMEVVEVVEEVDDDDFDIDINI